MYDAILQEITKNYTNYNSHYGYLSLPANQIILAKGIDSVVKVGVSFYCWITT